MKSKYLKNSRGLTLVELIVTLSLIGITIFIVANFLFFANNAQRATEKEYAMQSDIRRTAEVTNGLVRYSKAVFAVPQSFVESIDVMDPGWSYLMVSPDSKRIVIMEYDETAEKHVEKIATEESANILYYVLFEKDEEAKGDNVLKYEIYAYTEDEYGNKKNIKLVFETTVEAVNAIQVADKGTVAAPSVALAFRSDGQTSGKGKNQIAYITIIVDTSGSMGDRLGSDTKSKIANVRTALYGDGSITGTGIIQQFAKEENVFLSLVPFATTANAPNVNANSYPDRLHEQYEVYESSDLNSLITLVNGLQASGGTNTGDALRRAYYLHENFRDRNSISATTQVHHYIIMLVDGQTTYEASYVDWEDDGYYIDSGQYETIEGQSYKRFNWVTDFGSATENDALLPDGNIDIKYKNDAPDSDPLEMERYYYGTISYRRRYWFWWITDSYTGRIVEYGKENDTPEIRIIGNGSSIVFDDPDDPSDSYVDRMGAEIRAFGSGINSYIIGYANNLGSHVGLIGESIGADPLDIYRYDDPDFDLDEIFKNIATDIMADFWLAAGPQIMN